MSERTERRTFIYDGYRRCVISERITILDVNWDRRKRFCRQTLTWTVRENLKIMLGVNNKIYVWKKPDGHLNEFGDKERTCLVFVMFWECTSISNHGVKPLSPVNGSMITDKYISILDGHLWPVVAQHFRNRPVIFQEDNTLCHVSAKIKKITKGSPRSRFKHNWKCLENF